ncbi:unnamed protein product, partial [Sphacelaria rigidula]
ALGQRKDDTVDADETSVESAHTGDGLAEDLRPFVALLRRQRMRNTQAQDGFAAAATEQGAETQITRLERDREKHTSWTADRDKANIP